MAVISFTDLPPGARVTALETRVLAVKLMALRSPTMIGPQDHVTRS